MIELNPLECALNEADTLRWLVVTARAENVKLSRENTKLRELALALTDCRNTTCDDCVRWDYPEGGCSLDGVMRELGIEATPRERMRTNEVPQEASDHRRIPDRRGDGHTDA